MKRKVVWKKSLKDCNVVIRSGRVSLADAIFKAGGVVKYLNVMFGEGILLVDCCRHKGGWETLELIANVRDGSTVYGFRADMWLVYYSDGRIEIQVRKEIGNE
jgi:hypothetical protein